MYTGSETRAWYRRWWVLLVFVILLRYACHSVMLLMALVAERRPAPTLPDAVLSLIPRIEWIDRYNYHIWLLCYLPLAVVLGFRHFGRFLRYMTAGAIMSILRGLCILTTGLGPVHGPDLNANISMSRIMDAWVQLINPFSTLIGDAAHLHLTKDLYFSGHTATTFMLLLYCWRDPVLRLWALAGHMVVVATVFLSHLHYTIDVIGAWTMTFSVYCLFEWVAKPESRADGGHDRSKEGGGAPADPDPDQSKPCRGSVEGGIIGR